MPAKLVTKEVQAYIPDCCKKDKFPLTVYFKTLNKTMRDDYMSSLYKEEDEEYKPDLSLSHAFERFLNVSLFPKDKIFISNARRDEQHIKNKGEAITFLMQELHPDISDEIEKYLRAQSSLSEEEVKN